MFSSPLAWLMLAVIQVLLAYSFLRLLQTFSDNQGKLQALPSAPGLTRLVAMPLFEVTAFVLMLVVPLITMRLVADERRTGTMPLLLSAPVATTSIILGKYLGALIFVLCVIAMSAAMPLSLMVEANLDLGLLAAGVLALTLIGTTFTAVGLYMSTWTSQATIAAMTTFGLLLFLWLLDWGGEKATLLTQLSLLTHFRALLRGVIDSRDVAYFVLMSVTFFVLAVRRLDSERAAG
jgi:ABC-2 type transport system permease protein